MKTGPETQLNPYLPNQKYHVTESLLRIRYRYTYYIWKCFIEKYIRRNLTNRPLRILDVGCGPGNFLRCLKNWFHDTHTIGLDLSSDLLEYASKKNGATNLLQGYATELPFRGECFDVVSALQVIEHLSNPEKFLKEVHIILKKNGILILTTPNPKGVAARLMGDRWGGIRDDHISLRSPADWRNTLASNGFQILKEGTTLFNGIPIIGRFPLGFPFQVLQAFFGFFPWCLGESYMVVASKH